MCGESLTDGLAELSVVDGIGWYTFFLDKLLYLRRG